MINDVKRENGIPPLHKHGEMEHLNIEAENQQQA
jgi:hypothetical protein